MDENLMSIITLGAVILSAIVNIVGLVSKREIQAAAEARRNAQLDSITEKMSRLETCQQNVDMLLRTYLERITVVEESNRNVWRRMTELLGDLGNKEDNT